MSKNECVSYMRDSGSAPPGARESSSRSPGGIRQFLRKVKNGLTNPFSRLNPSRSRDPFQGASSGVEPECTDPRSVNAARRIAHEAVNGMDFVLGPAITVVSTAQNAQTDLTTADNIQATYLQPLKVFDAVIGKIANVHPYAKMALGVLSCASKMVLAQANRDQAVHRLLDKLDQVYDFMTQDETLNHISSMRTVLGQISQQTLECARFIRDYSETKNFWKRLGKDIVSETDDTIQRYSDVFDGLMQNFRDQAVRDVAIFIHRTGEILDLSGMTYATGAGLDTRKQCLPGTRTEILSQITEWVNSTGDAVPRVLWLSGPAGKGKSAIAHTIASWFNDVGGLGSCFCFDRHRDADRRHEKVFSTIARDLADHDPEMRRALAVAVQNASSLKNAADIVQQWDKLLMKPLEKLSGSTVGPVLIVIDALDESGGVETRRHLLNILAGKFQDQAVPKITELPSNFRILVTSRPLPDIDDEFDGVLHIRRMCMDDFPTEFVERDIRTYISQELTGLSDVGGNEFAVLAKKADGLFEWARLACAYIKQTSTGLYPIDRFNAVVNRDLGERNNLLYDMYRLMLTEIMHANTSTNARHLHMKALARFHSVMGQILGTAEPLPLVSLNAMRRHFPDQGDRYEVEVVVKSMGSFLSGTTKSDSPIRPLHSSFWEFLTDPESGGDFFVDVPKVQPNLAFASLRVMEHELRFNICDLKSSYLPNCKVVALREQVERCISPHLSYSCRFWAMHILRTMVFNTELAKELILFFDDERLLFWLEALSLIDALNHTYALSSAVPTLSHIAQWLKGHPGYDNVLSTAMDVQRFIQIFGSVILHSTPHLYVSALPFSPVNSALSRKFAAKFLNTLRVASYYAMDWTATQSVLSGHTDEVRSVSFSPDGTRIVTGSADKTIRLWDAATGQPFGQLLRAGTAWVQSVSFSPDGTLIVSGLTDNTVRLWDAAKGQPFGQPLRGHTDVVESVSFSPNGTLIVSGSKDNTVRLWNTTTGQPFGRPLRGHTRGVCSVSFSPDGARVVSGSEDKTLRLWNAATGQPCGVPLQGHTHWVCSASFSPDGTRIVSGSWDNTLRLWDATSGQPLGGPFHGHTGVVKSVSFSPNGDRIVSGSWDKTVRLWDTATGQPCGQPLQGHTSWVQSASFSPDGTRIVSGSTDKTVRLWDTATGQPSAEPSGHTQGICSVSFSPDRTCIVSGSTDMTVRLWDAVTGQSFSHPLQGHVSWVQSVMFSPDGTLIASGSWDAIIRLWDVATGKPFSQPLRGHTDSILSVSFSPDGTRIVSGSLDTTIRLWDVATGQPLAELRGHTGAVQSVSFSPDGTCIISGSKDKTLRLWDAVTGQQCGCLHGHIDSVQSVSFSPDGSLIASGSKDKTVRLWDTATGQPCGQPLQGHTDSVQSVSFSPDSAHIASGSSDKTVRLWDTATGQLVGQPLWGHTDSVQSVSFSSDGTRIVSGSVDGTIRLLDAAMGQVVEKGQPPNDDTGSSTNIWHDHGIRFSSNSTHALHNAAELIQGASHNDPRSSSFLLGADGWMVGPNRRLLFWVPPASRQALYSPWTALVIPRGRVELDLSRMAHGQHWRYCRAHGN